MCDSEAEYKEMKRSFQEEHVKDQPSVDELKHQAYNRLMYKYREARKRHLSRVRKTIDNARNGGWSDVTMYLSQSNFRWGCDVSGVSEPWEHCQNMLCHTRQFFDCIDKDVRISCDYDDYEPNMVRVHFEW